MKWKRCIVHADLNHCYAQIEEMLYPELRNVPMVVGGSEASRHGIVLAKNDKAKEFGIKTAEPLRDAYKKCRNLLVIPPHFEEYQYYSERVKDIYREYTDKVESFGLDEAWFDLTDSQMLFGDPVSVAKTIQKRILKETGLTVSMGVSFNKVFAKLGSDLDKKMGFTVISPENFEEMIYPLPCEDLLYVGRATKEKLRSIGILTIGDIAKKDPAYLRSLLGKNGEMIWFFAKGYDVSDVKLINEGRTVKSMGNGVTAVRDLKNMRDVRLIFWVLSESIAARLKETSMVGSVISVSLRDHNLQTISRQRKVEVPTNLAKEIFSHAVALVGENAKYDAFHEFVIPYRSVAITVSGLSKDSECLQLNLFEDVTYRKKERDLEVAVDKIREKFGFSSVQRLVVKMDEELTNFNPKEDHVIHPESWF